MVFYETFKWLALFGKISGHFPVQNVLKNDPSLLRYKMFSGATFYALSIYLVCCYFQFLHYGCQFTIETRFHQLLETMVYGIILRSFFSFSFCLYYHAKHVPKVIMLLDSFDKHRNGIVIQKTSSMFNRVIFDIIIPMALTLSLSGLYFLESSQLVRKIYKTKESQEDHISSAFFGICGIWHTLPPMYFIYFSIKISIGFNQINQTLVQKQYCSNYFNNDKQIEPFDKDMGENISKLRLLHNLLSEATFCLSRCYGSFMAVNTLFLIVAVVVHISTYVCATKDTNVLMLVCVDSFNFFVITVVASVIKKKAVKVARLFQGIPTSALSEKSREEIQLWLLQLTVHPIQVNAGGYFILDKSQSFEVSKVHLFVGLLKVKTIIMYKMSYFLHFSNVTKNKIKRHLPIFVGLLHINN
ncbi:hypothetical protein ABEB36_001027 [Hypothenemus hampei]|uniref:Gustatory receptor n=1 Tax=Hypothenemus hampei TaxID=57062 RepID=A0ABD1FF21_HYPHA